MGTWIEINECHQFIVTVAVVPFVGTWIEIEGKAVNFMIVDSRTLRGYVD